MKRLLCLEWLPLISNRTKIIISISLVLFSGIMVFVYGMALGSLYCFAAMCLSFIGDMFLNCKPQNLRPRKFLYCGAIFFMLAHIFYSIAYLNMNQGPRWNVGTDISVKLMLFVFLISFVITATREENDKVHPITTIIFFTYLLVISVNFISICTYSQNYGALSYLGATFFLVSDYIIGLETVLKIKSNLLRKLVWIFYPIGQAMIIGCR